MKMNKKGFTLVELLAVIAILAILVVMAVPNVLGLFQGAKVSTFISQVESLYKSAESEVVSKQLTGTTSSNMLFCYSTATSGANYSSTNKMNISGNGNLHYYIEVTGGKITSLYAEDGAYGIEIASITGITDIAAVEDGKYKYIGTYKAKLSKCSAAPTANSIKNNSSVSVS